MNLIPTEKLGKTMEAKLETSATGLTLRIACVTIPRLPSAPKIN